MRRQFAGRAARSLIEVLDSLEPHPDFPDVDDSDLLALRDIGLE
jgi:hypothetical protein